MSIMSHSRQSTRGLRPLSAALVLGFVMLFGAAFPAAASPWPPSAEDCKTSAFSNVGVASCPEKDWRQQHRAVATCAPGYPWGSPQLTRTAYGPWTAGQTSVAKCSFGRAVSVGVQFQTPLW